MGFVVDPWDQYGVTILDLTYLFLCFKIIYYKPKENISKKYSTDHSED